MNKRWHEIFPRSGKGKQMIQIIDWIQQYQMHNKRLLDFGCGKGGTMDWIRSLYSDVQVTGWDPGTDQYHTPPKRQFDGIYSIDVWEHIEREDLDHTITQLKRLSHPKTEWCHIIDLTPARKRLPDGRNAHVTLMTAREWMQFFQTHTEVTQCSQFAEKDKLYGERVRCQIHCRP